MPENRNSADYADRRAAERIRFLNHKRPTATILLRPPAVLPERIKVAANKRDMPYQSLVKAWLAEKVEEP